MWGRSYKEVNVGVTDDEVVEMVNKFCKGTLEVRCEVVEEYCNRGTVQEDNKMQTVGLKKDNVFPEEVVKIINNLHKEPQQHTHYKPLIWWRIDLTSWRLSSKTQEDRTKQWSEMWSVNWLRRMQMSG